VRFLIDAMLPPQVVDHLAEHGHVAVTPADLGAHSLPDEQLIRIAAAEGLVIVTENALDFAHVTTCPVVFVRKSWWPRRTLAGRLATALAGWAEAYPQPGSWPHWLPAKLR
jgi:hypothetical protein